MYNPTTRKVPTLYYVLPIVLFSFNECVELNKIISNNLLPKCGIMSHTPRSLIFSPVGIGGFDFEHIWTKQLILHLELFQLHLRRGDALGQRM